MITYEKVLTDKAAALIANGWGPIPIPTGQKAPPPNDFIRAIDPMPDLMKYVNYQERHNWQRRNMGVRVPPGVIGLDVDSYKDKGEGWRQWRGEEWPATVRTSARGFDDGMGHWFYRLPEGADERETKTGLPGHLDTLRFTHRFSMLAGNTHPEGMIYQTIDFRTGESLDTLPPPAELPVIPDWLWEMFKRQERVRQTPTDHPGPAPVWNGQDCPMVQSLGSRRFTGNLSSSRHDLMVRTTYALIAAEQEGHPGVPAALEALRASFVEAIEADPNGRVEKPEQEFAKAVAGARRQLEQIPPEDIQYGCACAEGGLSIFEPVLSTLWTSRPMLEAILHLSAMRMVSPWAVLGATLAFLAAETPPWVVLPDIAGPQASLNMYVALVGGPSAGKTGAIATAEEMAPFWASLGDGWTSTRGGAGSGEGLAATFSTIDTKGVQTWHSRRAVFVNDEITTLEAVQSQNASTLQGFMLSAWSGSPIHANYKGQNRISLPRHSYRLSMIAGAQPKMVEFITTQHHRGTPQRWLWMSADVDPDAMAPSYTVAPGAFLPRELYGEFAYLDDYEDANMVRPKIEIQFPDDLRMEIRWRLQEARAGRLKIRQHSDLLRMKVAALLAISEERMRVEREDWDLADRIVAHSERQYDHLMELQTEALREGIQTKGRVQAEIAEATEDARVTRQAQRFAAVVARHAAEPPASKRTHGQGYCGAICAGQYISTPVGMDKKVFRQRVIQYAQDRGLIRVTTGRGPTGAPSIEYRP